jgi:hypothetical protein
MRIDYDIHNTVLAPLDIQNLVAPVPHVKPVRQVYEVGGKRWKISR